MRYPQVSQYSKATSIGLISAILLLANLLFPPTAVFAQGKDPQDKVSGDDTFDVSTPPRIDLGKTWKISSHQGGPAWSPQKSDLLAVSYRTSVVLLDANGTEIKTVMESDSDSSIGRPKFNFDGSKMAFRYGSFANSTSKLFVYDIASERLDEIRSPTNNTGIYDFSWDINDNIIYGKNSEGTATPYQIVSLDLQTGTESILMNLTWFLDGLDVRPDGKKIVVAMSIGGPPYCYGNPAVCNSQLVLYDLEPVTSTDGGASSIKINEDSSIVITESSSIRKGGPRWSIDGSYIIFAGEFYRGGSIFFASSDGTEKGDALITTDGKRILDDAYYSGVSVNKDRTMVAYSIIGRSLSSENFNGVNRGMYISHTSLCESDTAQCPMPIHSIPIISEPASGFTITRVPEYNSTFTGYMNSDYGKVDRATLDVKSKKISVLFENVRNTNDRDIQLYIPSNVLSGNMTVFINGTQFYPSLVGDVDDCLSRWSETYCTDIKAEVDGIEGWSIIRISDNTTNPRSAVLVEVIGTTAVPEFGSIAVFAMASAMIGSVVAASRLKRSSQ